MAFLGVSRRYWWGKSPIFAVLDFLFLASIVVGVALLFISRPAALIVLVLGVPLFWFARNTYIRGFAYGELGMDPTRFVPEVIGEEDGWKYLGVGVWSHGSQREPVRVLLSSEGKYFFQTADGYLYGENVGGGYGPEELFTLFLQRKLSLNPDEVHRLSDAAVAVIRSEDGRPLFADTNSRENLKPLDSNPVEDGEERETGPGRLAPILTALSIFFAIQFTVIFSASLVWGDTGGAAAGIALVFGFAAVWWYLRATKLN